MPRRKKVEIWLTRDAGPNREYYTWVCCHPRWSAKYKGWVDAGDCRRCDGFTHVWRGVAERHLGGPMKGGPRSIRRLV